MWYYQDGSERKGPIDEATIKSMMANGSISIDTLVWKTGMGTWVPLQQTELAATLPAPPPVVPPRVGASGAKSRVAYVLLAVLLGCGIHNFYAGYTGRAVIQLLIALLGGIFTCGISWIVTWIWAVIEACTVTHDAQGAPLD